MTSPAVHVAAWTDVDPLVLHDLVRLRVDVFVVEQECCYPELDGRDVEPATLHLWTADESGPTSYLRLLTDTGTDTGSGTGTGTGSGTDDVRRIGRVVTRADARGAGLSKALVAAALERSAGQDVVLEAQAHLTGFYGRFGFVATGPEYLDDGIPHVPMRRPAPTR